MKFRDELKPRNFWGNLKKAPGITREQYLDKLIVEKDHENISALMGVRRSGKSTLLIQLIEKLIKQHNVPEKNTLFINFEDPRLIPLTQPNELIDFLTNFYDNSDNRSRVYLFLDEIQNVKNWEAVLRTLQDTLAKCKIYLTGSSASLLGKELGTKLAGRYLSTEVMPLSFAEYKVFSKKVSLSNYIYDGSFPNVVLTKLKETRVQLLQDYFDSILIKDISIRYSIRNDYKLRRLAQTLFTNIANQASSYRLSKDLGLSPETVLQYFKYIEDSYLGFFVAQYSTSLRKQEYNPKKFYGIDTGLQDAISFKTLDDRGKLFENLVFLAIRRKYKQIFYYEEEKEIDFIVKQAEQIKYLINASVSIKDPQAEVREIESLKYGMYKLGLKESYLVLESGEDRSVMTDIGKIHIISFESFLKLIEDNKTN